MEIHFDGFLPESCAKGSVLMIFQFLIRYDSQGLTPDI